MAFLRVHIMSALPPKADIVECERARMYSLKTKSALCITGRKHSKDPEMAAHKTC